MPKIMPVSRRKTKSLGNSSDFSILTKRDLRFTQPGLPCLEIRSVRRRRVQASLHSNASE